MHITIFGATGDVGRRVLDEAVRRGHQVVGVVRDKKKLGQLPLGVLGRVLDINETQEVAGAIADTDLVISALRPPDGEETQLPVLTVSVLEAASRAKKRVLIVGGAANLLVPNGNGHTVLSAPSLLPDSVRPIAAACFSQFMACNGREDADWVYFSPPATLRPGRRTGQFRRGSDVLIVDDDGDSSISMEDFAVAILNEADMPRENVKRVTVGY